MRVKCEIDGIWCEFPENISRLILKKTMIYICILDGGNSPFIQSVLFVTEPEKCTILFIVKKTTVIIQNLAQNPLIALTIDETHPIDPSQNEGIMIEAKTHISSSQDDAQLCHKNIQQKYGFDDSAKILGIDELAEYACVRAIPRKNNPLERAVLSEIYMQECQKDIVKPKV